VKSQASLHILLTDLTSSSEEPGQPAHIADLEIPKIGNGLDTLKNGN
jgi:hypothetical protein